MNHGLLWPAPALRWAALLLACALAGACGTPALDGPPTQVAARCTRIIDGDTLVVEISGIEETVRLLGIDADERRDEVEGARTLAAMAAERLRTLVLDRAVTLHQRHRGDRDAFGRLLAYVHVEGRDAGGSLLQEGFVTRYAQLPHPRHLEYAELERTARADRRGLWALAEQREAQARALGYVDAAQAAYIASWKSEVFHHPRCKHAASISPDNAIGFETREAAVESRRRPCRLCKP